MMIAASSLATPEYTNNQYYVWNTNQGSLATNALKYINVDSGWFPYRTNTLTWTDSVLTRLDGKLCFPRLPESLLDTLGIPQAQRELFFTIFSPSVDVYKDSWFITE
jgi:hypothetical protein